MDSDENSDDCDGKGPFNSSSYLRASLYAKGHFIAYTRSNISPIRTVKTDQCSFFIQPENDQAYNQLLYYKPGQLSNVLIDILTQEVEPRGAEENTGDNLEGATDLFQSQSPKHEEFYN